MRKPELHLDFCSYQAAQYACCHWHCSRKIPVGKLVKIGIWEGGKFIGATIFGDAPGAEEHGLWRRG